MVPFESLGMVSYSHSIATMAVSLALLTQYTNVADRQAAHDRTGRDYPQIVRQKLCNKSVGVTTL